MWESMGECGRVRAWDRESVGHRERWKVRACEREREHGREQVRGRERAHGRAMAWVRARAWERFLLSARTQYAIYISIFNILMSQIISCSLCFYSSFR